MAYATLNELKLWLRMDTSDTSDDTIMTYCLNSATASIDQYCDTTFTPTYPPSVVTACLMQATRYYKRRDAWAGTTGGISGDGYEIRLLSSLDSDVKLLLAPHRIHWWVA